MGSVSPSRLSRSSLLHTSTSQQCRTMSGDLVLITGATGLVGFGVLRAALEHGYKLRAAVRSEQKAEIIRSNPTMKGISEHQLSFVIVPDILAEGAFDEAVKGVKFILHVASPVPRLDLTG